MSGTLGEGMNKRRKLVIAIGAGALAVPLPRRSSALTHSLLTELTQ